MRKRKPRLAPEQECKVENRKHHSTRDESFPKNRNTPVATKDESESCEVIRFGVSGMENLKRLENLKGVRITERREHNLRAYLVKHGIAPTPDVLAAYAEKSGKDGAEANRQTLEQSIAGQNTGVEHFRTETKIVKHGKFCDQVIDEIRRIKNLFRGTGRSVAEIQQEYPDWAVWKVRDSLGEEDRGVFNHPNRWEAPVGYAKMVLSKTQGVSQSTITSWVKAYRRDQKTKKA